MKALEDPKLTKTDVMRLRTLIQASTIYQKRLAEYVDYRRIERKLVEMDEFFERLKKDREEKETIKKKPIYVKLIYILHWSIGRLGNSSNVVLRVITSPTILTAVIGRQTLTFPIMGMRGFL